MNHVAPIRRSYHRDTAECGHGTCGAAVDCTGECAMKALPVIDEKFLDEQIRETGSTPIQFAGDEPGDGFWWKWALSAIGGGLLIAVVIYVSTK